MKRILSLIVAFVIVLTIIPSSVFSVGASGVSLDQLQNKYPHGKYWNGNNADSYTSQPCNHHGSCSYTGSCGCNTFKGYAIQCMGFAYQLAHLIYGGDPYAEWTPNRSTTALDSLKAGDVVRYKNDNHSIFITNVSGETVTYADCNSDGHCIIRWNQTISKSTIKSTFTYVDAAPYAWQVGEHTHSYSGSNFESVHPHRIYQKCSCGQTRYTGETTAYASCSTCMKVSIAYVQPVKAYTIKTGKTTVYSTVNGTEKTNKIYDTDLCTINAIYDCGWCKVTFPLDAGGTDTGYVKIDVFMKSGGFITYASKQLETFSRSDLKTSVGYAAEKDKIYILGNTTSAVQIAYPLTAGGYKVGWVPISSISATIKYNANGGSGTMASKTVQYQKAFTLSDNVFTKTGYSFKGWNCYRSSDKTWYTNDKGWKTESEITENGYEKKFIQTDSVERLVKFG